MPLIGRYKCVIIGILKPKGNSEHSHQRNTVVDWVSVQDQKPVQSQSHIQLVYFGCYTSAL